MNIAGSGQQGSPKANCLCLSFQECLWDADGHGLERTSEEKSSFSRASIKWGFPPASRAPGLRAASWTRYQREDPGVCPAGESAEAVPGAGCSLPCCGLLPSHAPAEEWSGQTGSKPSPGDDFGHRWVEVEPSPALLTFVSHQRLILLSVLSSVHVCPSLGLSFSSPTFPPLSFLLSPPSPHSLPFPLHHLFGLLLWTRW